MPLSAAKAPEELCDTLAAGLVDKGYVLLDNVLEMSLCERLVQAAEAMDARGGFAVAGTGRNAGHRRDSLTRSDSICWLRPELTVDAAYLRFCEELRLGLNRRLLLGLLDQEAHYARYQPGAFYARHRDAFAGQRNRMLSTVFYLNRDWPEGAGGELVLYDDSGERVLESLAPRCNRLIVFLSEVFPHEVKPATRTRYSIAGWFRLRR